MVFFIDSLTFALLFILFFMCSHGVYRLYLKVKGRRYDRRKTEPVVFMLAMILTQTVLRSFC